MTHTMPWGFTTLWIYTLLKQCSIFTKAQTVSLPYGFTLFSNSSGSSPSIIEFHYLMDLHYSQTTALRTQTAQQFHYLMDLHYSQS